MDLSSFLNSTGLTITGIFYLGFFSGIIFWSFVRGLIPKIIFFLVLFAAVGYFSSNSTTLEDWLNTNKEKVTNEIKTFVEDKTTSLSK